MSLQNYTSAIPANKSIMMIEEKLVRHGATHIQKIYENNRLISIDFIKEIDGYPMAFRLPAQIKACENILRSNVKRPRKDTYKNISEQAEKTAWKIVFDWVCAQMTMIQLSQVEFLQVFMSYLYSPVDKKTYFEIIKEKGVQKLLPEAIIKD